MEKNWTEEFLEEIADRCFPKGLKEAKVREREFLLRRFHTDNSNQRFKKHTEIAQAMSDEIPSLKGLDLKKSIPTTCQNVVRTIARKYEAQMIADGMNPSCFFKGEAGHDGYWEKIYHWLHDKQFPRWRMERIWQIWRQQANPKQDWISFDELEIDPATGSLRNSGKMPIKKIGTDFSKMPMKIPESVPIPRTEIEINKPFRIRIELDNNNECYFLLLNRGWDSQEKEATRCLLCPSQAFAPEIEPFQRFLFLPQKVKEGTYEKLQDKMEFDATGRDEYIGIVLLQKPNYLDWMIPSKHNVVPSWNETQIYKLWQELEQQSDWQVFYQSFELVNPSDS